MAIATVRAETFSPVRAFRQTTDVFLPPDRRRCSRHSSLENDSCHASQSASLLRRAFSSPRSFVHRCNHPASLRADEPGSKGTIGVSLLTLTNPFFKVIADNITSVAAKQGYSVIVVSGDFDVAKQQNQIKDFIVKKVSAIVLSPCDSKSIGPAIQEANEAGIPVFTCDIKSLTPAAKVVSHIATDNYQGGKMAGQAMIEALGDGGGQIAILDFKQAESCLLRVKGFKEVIEAHNVAVKSAAVKNSAAGKGGAIEIVAELPGDGQKERGYKSAEDCLQSHGNLAGIFAINDPCALARPPRSKRPARPIR